jgi:hypothetical protein
VLGFGLDLYFLIYLGRSPIDADVMECLEVYLSVFLC